MAVDRNREATARLELMVGINNTSYKRMHKQLESMFDSRHSINLELDNLNDIANDVRKALAAGGSDVDAKLAERFDVNMSHYLTQYSTVLEEMKALSVDDLAGKVALQEKARLMREEFELEATAHADRMAAAKKLKAANPFGSMTQKKATGEAIGGSIISALDKVKAGDISGLTESLAESLGKALMTQSSLMGLASQSAGSDEDSARLAVASTELAGAAVAIGALAGMIASALAMFVMMDEQAKDLNKTLMENASIADFSYKNQNSLLLDMTSNLDNARRASINMAFEMRGSSEEMSQILTSLNQAGYSYKEIAKGTSDAASETNAYAEAIRNTFKWSQALGMSTSEVAETTADWSTTFGLDLVGINEKFASIASFAKEGGFNVKRFFSAVSQATAGMALYNVRMEEAAFLLAKTQKILGGTDASDFIKSLTQGFADESILDRTKRNMIVGAGDASRIFQDTAKRTVKSFVDTFGSSKSKETIQAAFDSVGIQTTIFGADGAKNLEKTWAKLSATDRRLVIGTLRKNGDEQDQAAAQQLETLGRVLDAANGGQLAQVRGLAALDMQGKLAYKLQSLGDKRLNDMSLEELAAFESYAGISGSQLEQLMRVESQLMADYELAKKEGTTTARTFEQFVSSNEEAGVQLKKIEEIEDQATYFTRKSVENTRSLFTLMKNTIAATLNNIYDLLLTWFGSTQGLTQESLDKQSSAIEELRSQRETNHELMSDLDKRMETIDKTLHTTGANTKEHMQALQDKSEVEAQQRNLKLADAYQRAQERNVLMLEDTDISGTKDSTGVLQAAAERMRASGEDLEIAAKNMTVEDYQALSDKISTVTADTEREHAGDIRDPEAPLFEMPLETKQASATAQISALQEAMGYSTDLDAEGVSKLLYLTEQGEDAKIFDKKQAELDKKWRDSEYSEKAELAHLDALKAYEGWKLGMYAGLSGPDLDSAITEWSTGDTAAGIGKLAESLAAIGFDTQNFVAQQVGGVMGNDFVMRPGQPAQRFNPSDTVIGLKAGGPLAGNTPMGGNTIVNIYGGDQNQVFQTVKKALKARN